MEIIDIENGDVFLLETENNLNENLSQLILNKWNEIFPGNKLIILKKGQLKLIRKSKED